MARPWVITASNRGWHVRDLERAFALRKVPCVVAPFTELLGGPGPGGSAPDFRDAAGIFVRTIPGGTLEQVVFRMDLLHLAQESGIQVLNPPKALEGCVDKFLTTARLARHGIPVPPTITCQKASQALEAFHHLGGDVVFKPLFGSEGRGMVRVTDPETAWRVTVALENIGAAIYAQAFVRHPGWDLRVFTLGGKVLTAMTRHSKDDWRTNISQGGEAKACLVPTAAADLALASSDILGAEIAGVDLLQDQDGKWWVIEVNAVPGWRGLSQATGMDIALELVDYAIGAGQ